ncbi:hypothetical protein L2E82_08970 [Cichorium intybus]|uniref:Uncharacterized protein n=1 Tax=Cichorium intybus TaxID=13427 RepID=A0ACB9G7A8_CICIN|nr:hypothetical protein L2E82_08970 [Cichorium intybus]
MSMKFPTVFLQKEKSPSPVILTLFVTITKVDLGKLEMAALRRYWAHFNLMDASSNLSKDQLVECRLDYHYWSRSMVAGGLPTAVDG